LILFGWSLCSSYKAGLVVTILPLWSVKEYSSSLPSVLFTFAARIFLAGYFKLASFKLLVARALLSAELCLYEFSSKLDKIMSSVLALVATASLDFSSNASGRRSSASLITLSSSYLKPIFVS
jgi:hypothetical protein